MFRRTQVQKNGQDAHTPKKKKNKQKTHTYTHTHLHTPLAHTLTHHGKHIQYTFVRGASDASQN